MAEAVVAGMGLPRVGTAERNWISSANDRAAASPKARQSALPIKAFMGSPPWLLGTARRPIRNLRAYQDSHAFPGFGPNRPSLPCSLRPQCMKSRWDCRRNCIFFFGLTPAADEAVP